LCAKTSFHELGKTLATSVLDHEKFGGMPENFKHSVRQLARNVLSEKCPIPAESATEEQLLTDVFGGSTLTAA
jgi:hypothetical protein